MFIASPAGGTSIEDVAAATPELIFTQPIDIIKGMTDEQSTFLATSLGFIPGTTGHANCKGVVEKLYQMFRKYDCTLVEVNPLAETPDGRVVVCDAKVTPFIISPHSHTAFIMLLIPLILYTTIIFAFIAIYESLIDCTYICTTSRSISTTMLNSARKKSMLFAIVVRKILEKLKQPR